MREILLETPDDISWLKTGHLKGVPLPEKWKDFKSASMQGNEDSPNMVDLYLKPVPLITDPYFRVKFLNEELVYAECQEFEGRKNDIAGEVQEKKVFTPILVMNDDREAAKKGMRP